MGTVTSRLNLFKPGDGGAGEGGDDIVDVTADLGNNFDTLDAAAGLFHCTSGTRPVTGNYVGRLILETDTGKSYRYDGAAWKFFTDTLAGIIRVRNPTAMVGFGAGVSTNMVGWTQDYVKGTPGLFTFAAGAVTVVQDGTYALTSNARFDPTTGAPISTLRLSDTGATKHYCFAVGGGVSGSATFLNAATEVFISAGSTIIANAVNSVGATTIQADTALAPGGFTVRKIPGL